MTSHLPYEGGDISSLDNDPLHALLMENYDVAAVHAAPDLSSIVTLAGQTQFEGQQTTALFVGAFLPEQVAIGLFVRNPAFCRTVLTLNPRPVTAKLKPVTPKRLEEDLQIAQTCVYSAMRSKGVLNGILHHRILPESPLLGNLVGRVLSIS